MKAARPPPGQPERPTLSHELERYLAQGLEPDECDPVIFWDSRRNAFPQLEVCARNLQGITASSAPSERIFSMSGRMCSPLRSRMSDDLFEALMHAKC